MKGLTWDPVGKYIASQADDRSLKVWRTLDWQLETSITKPFDEVMKTAQRAWPSSLAGPDLVGECRVWGPNQAGQGSLGPKESDDANLSFFRSY